MTSGPSLTKRVTIGKLIGLAIGAAGYFLLPLMWPEVDPMLRWGILLWYLTFGALIGVFGVVTFHPVLRLPLPWWVRAPALGAWLNLVLVFFAHAQMRGFLEAVLGPDSGFTSPFWFVAEGALVGALIGYVATAIGGEGRATIDEAVQ